MVNGARPFTWSLSRALVCMAAASFVAGCGQRQTVIIGTVTLDGKPLPEATLDMFPVRGIGRVSIARTDANGRYETRASPVRLSVVVLATKVDGKTLDPEGGGMIDAKTSIVPEWYTSHATTPLTAEPVEHQTTTIDFSLTSAEK